MSLREVLRGLSEQSGQTEDLLTSRERELLANILRHARDSSGAETAKSVEAVLARAVGETLLQRASETVGRSVLEEIQQDVSVGACVDLKAAEKISVNSPPPPATGPRPPSPSGPGPGGGRVQPLRVSVDDLRMGEARTFLNSPPPPATGPRPPSPSGPGPGPGRVSVSAENGHRTVAVQEQPELLRAECVVLDEFLAPGELQELTTYVFAREHDFRTSEVISPGVVGGVIDPEYRRSRVLMDLGKHGDVILGRIQSALPRVLEKLGMAPFATTRVESQITASNHGDFFRHHSDNAEEEIASRQLTYVYFFHREPKAFSGGELRLHDSYRENGGWSSTGDYKAVVPEQNQIVFFPSSLLHEITPVQCPSQAFGDSRFTVNGWLHR
jgi:Rps23 Pro-64 3,4-dihydroxylase Tpa1-like proline 4-hydroxylase